MTTFLMSGDMEKVFLFSQKKKSKQTTGAIMIKSY